ncbi:MAG: ribonuclease H-like domain-containing protein [Acidobacteria bacterium]|nr:ribonuclease H-like domain-containing protein [Acidobacteriota bacterium]
MNLTERLRSVVRSGGSPAHDSSCSSDPPYVRRPGLADEHDRSSAAPANIRAVADLLGGEWRDWQGHRYLVVDRRYPPGHRHGRVAVADVAPDEGGAWPALGLLDPRLAGVASRESAHAREGRRVLFVDLETTGLSGGAGTYAFLVGCGWFDGAAFRVRQFLLTGYAAERGLLEATGEAAGSAAAIATYNGKTFDVPVIDTRCVLHRIATPFEGMPHVDMLHPARQLWRRPGSADAGSPSAADPAGSCRLTAIEAAVLGHVREDDVPGFEIPSRYFHYVRSGDPQPLAAVLEHNRLDLLSLALLTGRLAQLLDRGPEAALTAREAVGLGRLYQRGGRLSDARCCFARSVVGIRGPLPARQTVRRRGRHVAAAARRARVPGPPGARGTRGARRPLRAPPARLAGRAPPRARIASVHCVRRARRGRPPPRRAARPEAGLTIVLTAGVPAAPRLFELGPTPAVR